MHIMLERPGRMALAPSPLDRGGLSGKEKAGKSALGAWHERGGVLPAQRGNAPANRSLKQLAQVSKSHYDGDLSSPTRTTKRPMRRAFCLQHFT